MEEILNRLKTIQKEMDEQRLEIRESGKKVTEQVTHNISRLFEEKLLLMEENQEKIKTAVENQEKRIYYLEKQARIRNLVFFGIEETGPSYQELENCIIKWLEKYLSVKLTYNDVHEAKRIGKKEERPRPIVVTFATLGIKVKILKNKGALKDTHFYIKEDYPKYVLEKRKELQEQLKLERENGNTAVIKYDKLVVFKNNTKRKLPSSPDNVITPSTEKHKQVNKKNKTQQSDQLIKRSNSISEGAIKPGLLNFLVPRNTRNTNKDNSPNKQA